MYQLLIVDDEKQVREGLKKLLPWNDYGIEICGEAQNGEEALEIIQTHIPDIVFMDIQMPIMTGIELAQKIHKNYAQCRFIVLSGYDDFSLVRQAMKYGAVDYLLKPSGKEEIIQIIEEILDDLEDDIVSRLAKTEQMKHMKNSLFNRMVNGTISSREMREKLELLQIDFSTGPFAAVSVEIIHSGKEYYDNELRFQKILEVLTICDKIMETDKCGATFMDSSGRVSIIIKDFFGWEKDIRLRTALTQCVYKVKQKLHIDISVAVGNQVHSCRRLYESYQNALQTLSYKAVFGLETVLYCEEIKEYFSKVPSQVRVDSTAFKELIRQGDEIAVCEYVGNLLITQTKWDSKAKIYILKNSALELIILAFQCFDEMTFVDRNEIYEDKNSAFAKIMVQISPEGLKKELQEILKQVLDKVAKTQKERMSKPVFDAVHFIEMNYKDPGLSLQYLADEYHINAAYLGRIFKKETNSSFIDYLNRYRIKRAEELLTSTNFKGVELSKKVGFSSYNYFYVVFKKTTGKKPMDIRKHK